MLIINILNIATIHDISTVYEIKIKFKLKPQDRNRRREICLVFSKISRDWFHNAKQCHMALSDQKNTSAAVFLTSIESAMFFINRTTLSTIDFLLRILLPTKHWFAAGVNKPLEDLVGDADQRCHSINSLSFQCVSSALKSRLKASFSAFGKI